MKTSIELKKELEQIEAKKEQLWKEEKAKVENDLEYDSKTQTFIPKPIKEYPLTDFRRINQYE